MTGAFRWNSYKILGYYMIRYGLDGGFCIFCGKFVKDRCMKFYHYTIQ